MLPYSIVFIKEKSAFEGKLLPCLSFFSFNISPFSYSPVIFTLHKKFLYSSQQKLSRCLMRSTNKQFMELIFGSPRM